MSAFNKENSILLILESTSAEMILAYLFISTKGAGDWKRKLSFIALIHGWVCVCWARNL